MGTMRSGGKVTGLGGAVRALVQAAVLLASHRAGADFIEAWTGSVAIPDNNPSGWAHTFAPSVPNASVTDVNVTLDIAGGFNGDLYAYLVHGAGFSVLLNRTGRDTGNPYGYATQGFGVTLDDDAPLVGGTLAADIHVYGGLSPVYDGVGRLTGTWQPDARTDDPATVGAGTANRTAFLSSFNGLDSDGLWTLFIADLSPLGVSTVQGVTVEVTQIPEPDGAAAILLGAIAVRLLRRRRPGR
jgi:subtilisin-like proprotein convertase family protein